ILPLFDGEVRSIAETRSPTVPPSLRAIRLTVDGATVNIGGLPHVWIIAEAEDYDEGAKYFCCWRNRQVVFPLHEADGTLRSSLTWKDISDKLLFEPLHSRCHASPCELGWS